MAKRLSVKLCSKPAITISRAAFHNNNLVYIARANRKFYYPVEKSRIVYIGTTKKGVRRIASSAAWKGEALLSKRGVKFLDFHVVVCGKVSGLGSWKKLERALIIRFRETHGSVPQGNNQGGKIRWKREKKYFSTHALDQILKKLG